MYVNSVTHSGSTYYSFMHDPVVTQHQPYLAKGSFLNEIMKNNSMKNVSDVMMDIWAGKNEVCDAAVKAFQIMYSGNDKETLCKLRYVLPPQKK